MNIHPLPRAAQGTDAAALDELSSRFGFSTFRPGQQQLVRAVLNRRDALGVLPTGGGKSLCYLLPAALLSRPVVVVSPLIALMRDQVRSARGFGLEAHAVHSQMDPGGVDRVLLQVARPGRRNGAVLFIAPERIPTPGFGRFWSRLRPSLLVVDEAHCISSWGHDFRPSYRRIGVLVRKGLPVLAVTATATPQVQDDIATSLGLRDPVRVVTSFDRPNLFWKVSRHPRARLNRTLLDLRATRGGAIILYAGTRKRVAAARASLAALGLEVRQYHAGEPPALRARTERWFTDARRPTLVATNAFGMGIDRPDVRVVIHLDLPRSLEALYQEAGRAGRDGGPALCWQLDSGRSLSASPPGRAHGVKSLRRAHAALRMASTAGSVPLTDDSAQRVLTQAGHQGPEQTLARLQSVGWLRRLSDGRLWPVTAGREPVWDQSLQIRLEHGKSALKRYVRGQECRRRTVLEYFGERPLQQGCRGCDRCVSKGTPEGDLGIA